MENTTDTQAVALCMIAFVVTYLFFAWREERINKRCDEAWRDGYEMGQSVTKGRR